jgi:hypothetical protein
MNAMLRFDANLNNATFALLSPFDHFASSVTNGCFINMRCSDRLARTIPVLRAMPAYQSIKPTSRASTGGHVKSQPPAGI